MRTLVRATVDLVYLVVNIVRDRDQRAVRLDNPPMEVDEDVGETSDEETGAVRSSYHCCGNGEIPNHEGCDSDDTADTAELDTMHDESSDDSSTVVVSDPAGRRYVVSQLKRAPRGIRPVGIVRPH